MLHNIGYMSTCAVAGTPSLKFGESGEDESVTSSLHQPNRVHVNDDLRARDFLLCGVIEHRA